MLTVEDGTGLSNADSYVSVADADAYHEARGNTVWATLALERKEQLLRIASDYITYIFGPSFIGVRYKATQSLAWPRYSSTDYTLFELGVPREIKEATAELALVANSTSLMPNQTTMRKKSVKVGPIAVEYDASSWTGPRFVAATSRLAAFLGGFNTAAVSTARLIRT